MGKIFTYKDMIREMSIAKKEFKRFQNLSKITNSKELLKKTNIELNKIKDLLINIKYEEIKLNKVPYYDKNKNTYNIEWNTKIDLKFSALKSAFSNLEENNDDVFQKMKIETSRYILNYLELDIETNNFNSIHFPIDLPDYYKNIGLGVKIFRKAIEKFGYISSILDGPNQASFDAKLLLHHFLKSDDVYSVTKNNSGVLFISKNINIEKVIELINKYIDGVDKNNYSIDKDLKKYF